MESTSSSPWVSSDPPRSILIIRMHATGDVAITLPWCQGLRQLFPASRIDFLCMETVADLPLATNIFDNVLIFPDCDSRPQRLWQTLVWCRIVAGRRYDLIFDLQRNWVTRSIRIFSNPAAWSEFERYAPEPAGARVAAAFARAGFGQILPVYRPGIRQDLMSEAFKILGSNASGGRPLVVLNPAGLWPTRNWPIANYKKLAEGLIDRYDAKIVLIGTDRIDVQAKELQNSVRTNCINLVGKTSLALAYALLRHVRLVISEDSGLMHMAWTSGIPTIVLFGSTDSRWSRPTAHAKSFESLDLECGACMSEHCKYGDTRCLTRISPENVLASAEEMLSSNSLAI